MTEPAADAFHAGERRMQELAGARSRMAAVGGRVIRDHMPEQHRELFAKLPYLVVGSLDARGRPWASLLVGEPGFLATPDPRTMVIAARPSAGDPLAAHLAPGAPLGLLGIELHTRRRNRMNGRVAGLEDGRIAVRVEQSFGNCPRYIQAREPRPGTTPEPAAARAPQRQTPLLSAEAAAMVRQADTFFIASASAAAGNGDPREGVDVSHRGGKPGFVRLVEEGGRHVLTAPDFPGNLFFNTLGNLLVNPRAGLLFADFERGDLLLLTGAAQAVTESPEIDRFAGAERLLRFEPAEGVLLAGALPLRWTFGGYAPQLALTGSWDEAEAAKR